MSQTTGKQKSSSELVKTPPIKKNANENDTV